MPGLAKRSHGESNRSGYRPTANVSPFSQEAVPRILRRRALRTLQVGGRARVGRFALFTSDWRRGPGSGPRPRLQPVHLTYPVGVRDSAARGWGPKVSRRLNDLAESRFVNVRGCPVTQGPAVGPRHR